MRICCLLIVTFFCFTVSVSAQDILTTKPETVPMMFQATGGTEATLPAARYPQFSNPNSDNPTCGQYLVDSLSLAPISVNNAFTAVPGLVLTVDVPEVNRKSSSLLITWTIRIVGMGIEINPWPTLCSPWHGSINETFKGGQVYSQAYVEKDGSFLPVGSELGMTIPDGNTLEANVVSDPTHTGSYLLKPAFFDGAFPGQVKIKIYWKNDTSLKIFSKANFRNLIVTLIPEGNK